MSPLRARLALLTAFAAALAPAGAAEPSKEAAAAAQGVAASTKTATTPSDLYKPLRDPFAMGGAGAAPAPVETSAAAGSAEVKEADAFNIHSLALKGVMGTRRGDMALFTDPSGSTYVLKGGRLLDSKRKPVPGIKGHVKVKQKTVYLETPDKDVQTFILGEEEGL